MKLTINPALEAEANAFGDKLLEAFYSSTAEDIEGFSYSEDEINIKADPNALEAFKVGTKYLQGTDFAKDILEDFRDYRDGEKEYAKEEGRTYLMADFMEDLGYLEGFTGRNATQLTKYYLSENAIDDGSWNLMFSMVSDDGDTVAYHFCPLSFREHDGILWYGKVSTGEGICIPFDTL